MSDDILFIDKPTDITSFDVIRQLRTKLGVRKMGHAGTLDPLATGLLIIGVGQGTKKLEAYLKLPKTYIAEILLGIQTDSGDTDGAILKNTPVADIDTEVIRQTLDSLKGTHRFSVPLYSAVKVDGKALYTYARSGKTPPRIPEKEMTITNIELLDVRRQADKIVLVVSFDVASGTYIRVLGEAIGKKLGYPATLQALRRTSIGNFSIDNAQKLEEF